MKRVYEDPTMNVVVFETEDIMNVLPQTSNMPGDGSDGSGQGSDGFEEL